MRPFTERTMTNLQAFLVLAGSIALLVLVPHEWLRPLSVGVVLFAVFVVVGVRAYLRRLEEVVRALPTNKTAPQAALMEALLTERERRFLRLNTQGTTAEITQLLRRRQALFTSAAMGVAIPGVCAFIVVLFFYAD